MVNTKTPTDRYEATLRSAVEGGGKAPNMYVSGTLNAPLTDTLRARFTVYSNQDQGWFENEYNGKAFGARDTLMLRPVVTLAALGHATLPRSATNIRTSTKTDLRLRRIPTVPPVPSSVQFQARQPRLRRQRRGLPEDLYQLLQRQGGLGHPIR